MISAVTPPLDQGQLKSFTLFDTKDPFNSDGPEPLGSTSSGSTGSGTGSTTSPTKPPVKSGGSGSGSGSSGSGTQPAAAPTSAVISVNGDEGLVTVGGVFPVTTDQASNGIFQLVSLTQSTAKVAVAGGSYASGAPTLTLHVGQPVTLANTADGKRYTLELFPQGTAPPASASTGSDTSGTSGTSHSGTSGDTTTGDTSTTTSP